MAATAGVAKQLQPPKHAAVPDELPTNRQQTLAAVRRLDDWFHNLKLPDGEGGIVETRPDGPFGDFPQFKWDALADHLPSDLHGKTCLDIGTNSGFYAFQLAKRGGQVLGIDLDDHYLAQADFGRHVLDLGGRVDLQHRQIYSLAADAEAGRRFDVILFMGVFYHLRYPLLGLDVVANLLAEDGLLVFQTLQAPGETPKPQDALRDVTFQQRDQLAEPGWPRMAFFEHGFNHDPTNWWAADPAACESMLRSSGLKIVGEPMHETYLCRRDPEFKPVLPEVRRNEYLAALRGLDGHPA
jgi:tRNA (mo5U34)-methyltransferase